MKWNWGFRIMPSSGSACSLPYTCMYCFLVTQMLLGHERAQCVQEGSGNQQDGTPLLPCPLVWKPSARQGLRPFLTPIILRFTPIQGVNKFKSTQFLLMNFKKLTCTQRCDGTETTIGSGLCNFRSHNHTYWRWNNLAK
jgi:hypothetical protein